MHTQACKHFGFKAHLYLLSLLGERSFGTQFDPRVQQLSLRLLSQYLLWILESSLPNFSTLFLIPITKATAGAAPDTEVSAVTVRALCDSLELNTAEHLLAVGLSLWRSCNPSLRERGTVTPCLRSSIFFFLPLHFIRLAVISWLWLHECEMLALQWGGDVLYVPCPETWVLVGGCPWGNILSLERRWVTFFCLFLLFVAVCHSYPLQALN